MGDERLEELAAKLLRPEPKFKVKEDAWLVSLDEQTETLVTIRGRRFVPNLNEWKYTVETDTWNGRFSESRLKKLGPHNA